LGQLVLRVVLVGEEVQDRDEQDGDREPEVEHVPQSGVGEPIQQKADVP
jgi:hypothetical protein